jgi:DNA helicase-2/ATP-dependent DNA helicase PcrA
LGFLEQTALVSAVDNLDEDDKAVVLMTMHCAKGLEFDTVFIAGFEENLFPSAQSVTEIGGLEEERRLCYVALTRAKRQLLLLSTRSRLLYGNSRPAIPSRFLKEIPEELIEEIKKPSPENIRFKTEKQIKPKHILTNNITSVPLKSSKLSFKVGQRVKHKTFGEGTIAIVTAMSSDTLLEVNFETQGKKKLMANFAKLEVID